MHTNKITKSQGFPYHEFSQFLPKTCAKRITYGRKN